MSLLFFRLVLLFSLFFNQVNGFEQDKCSKFIKETEQNLNIPDGANNFIFDVLNNNTNLTFEDEEYKTVNTLKERYDRLTANNLILGSSFSLNTNSQESIFDDSPVELIPDSNKKLTRDYFKNYKTKPGYDRPLFGTPVS